jgi:hypothetical protein
MKKPSLICLSAALLGLLPLSLSAGEVRIRALAFQADFPPAVIAREPGAAAAAVPLKVKSFLNHEADTVSLRGSSLTFTKGAPAEDAQLGELEIASGAKSIILLFIAKSATADDHRSRVVAIDDSAKSFPPGSFKIANFSPVPVKIELGGQTYEIAPDEITLVDKPVFGETQTAAMRALCKKDDEWLLISSNSWTNPGTRRVLHIITRDPGTEQIELKSIRDVSAF